jgi:hypothetical protein
MGFGNFSGFTVNVNDSGSAPTLSNGSIEIVNAQSNGLSAESEDRSIFYNVPQNISSGFTASFVYTGQQNGADESGASYETGACFVLQNSGSGASAIGSSLGCGYSGFPTTSCAVTLELGSTASGYFTKGNYNGGSPSVNPVNLNSGDPIDVTLTYNGTLLSESLLDTATGQSYNASFLVSTQLSTLLGSSDAYVGFAANYFNGGFGFGGPSSENESISNFQFTTEATPEPSTVVLLGAAGIAVLPLAWRRRKQRPCNL